MEVSGVVVTFTLDEDIVKVLRAIEVKDNRPAEVIVNSILRDGLKHRKEGEGL